MEYEKISGSESYGDSGEIGIQVLISVKRELSADEKLQIYRWVELMHRNIATVSLSLMSEFIEQTSKERAQLLACFSEPIYVENIPNSYDITFPRPWFVITTRIGRFTIGWRKRVINIDWSQTMNKNTGMYLFPPSMVSNTVGDYNVHAYGYEEATEFIKRIMETV